MAHAFGHDEALIDVFVFMSAIFAFKHRQPNDRIVYLAKRLVVPSVRASIGQFLNIDQFKRSAQNVKVSLVRKIFRRFIGIHDLS